MFCGIAVVLAGFVFTALTLRGIVDTIPSRLCLLAAWVFAVTAVGLSEPIATKSWRHIIIAELSTALICGVALYVIDRRASNRAKPKTKLKGRTGNAAVRSRPKGRLLVALVTAAAIAAILIVGIVLYWPVEVYPAFRLAYDDYERELGRPLRPGRSNGELSYEAAHEVAMVIWSKAFDGFYKLPHDADRPWEFEHDPTWDEDNKWFDPKSRINLFHPPVGKKPALCWCSFPLA